MYYSDLYRMMGRTAGVIGVITLLLAVGNTVMFFLHQSQRAEVDTRTQFINDSAVLGRVNEALIRALATAAYNTNDTFIRDMLHTQGIDYSMSPAQGAKPAAAAPATPAGK